MTTGLNLPNIDSMLNHKSEYLEHILDQQRIRDEMTFFSPEVVEMWRRHSRMMRQQIPKPMIVMSSPSPAERDLFKHSRAIREHADNCWLWIASDRVGGDVRTLQVKKRTQGERPEHADLHLAFCYALQTIHEVARVRQCTMSRNRREGRGHSKTKGRYTRGAK